MILFWMILLAIFVVFINLIPRSPPRSIRGGYESHLDFLEAHGAITREERQAQEDFRRELEEHPERFQQIRDSRTRLKNKES